MVLAEVISGIRKAERLSTISDSLRAAHAWLLDRIDKADVVVLPFDRRAARLFGLVLGERPRTSASWQRDAIIATSAWGAGYAIATHNRGDFESIAALLRGVIGDDLPLDVAKPAV